MAMSDINNFITDLLDEMIAIGARSLIITPSEAPAISFDNPAVAGRVTSFLMQQVEKDELFEDLEALGLSVTAPYFFDYHSYKVNKSVFVKVIARQSGDFVEVAFNRMAPSGILQWEIDKQNPLPESKFLMAHTEPNKWAITP